jgi:glutathione S-transferase
MNRPPDTLARESAEKHGARYLALVNERLERQAWMLGEEFSLVDCCYAPVFDALSLAGEYLAAYPAIDRYLARARERRSWKACAFRTA